MDPSKWEEYGPLDAEIEKLLAEKPLPSLGTAGSPDECRELMMDIITKAVSQFPPPDLTGIKQETIQVPTRDGATIRALLFKPENNSGPGPLLINFHGGGFVAGGPELAMAEAAAMVKGFGATYLAIDYRKAPENKFPYAVHDAFDSLKWAYEHAKELNADPSKGLILAGASAGGLLAAAATLWARDNGIPVTGTHLFCPVLLHPESVPGKWRPYFKSYEQCKDAPVLDKKAMDLFFGHYEPDPESPLANLALWETGHKNLPPTYFAVCGHDPLRDDGLIYEKILQENGVKTKLDVFPGMFHCWAGFRPEHSTTADAMEKVGGGMVWLLTGAQ